METTRDPRAADRPRDCCCDYPRVVAGTASGHARQCPVHQAYLLGLQIKSEPEPPRPEPPPAADRYRTDPAFRRLVDAQVDLLRHAEFTPEDLRAAAVLAATLFYRRYGCPPAVAPGPRG